MSDPFEAFIETQLKRHLGPLVGSAVPPSAGRFAAAAISAGISASAGSGLFAALSTKTAVGIAAAGLAAGGGGAVAATYVTGSASPSEWGQQVRAAVTQCRTQLSPGERGIGHCVTITVSSHELPATPRPATTAAHGPSEVIGGFIEPKPTPTPAPVTANPSPPVSPKHHHGPPDEQDT